MTKSTRKTYMTPAELDSLREEMGCKWRDISHALPIKYRTLQDYAAGKRRIPEDFAKKVKALAAHVKKTTERAIANVCRQIDRDHPHGITSGQAE